MTTIVWSGGELAADRQATIGAVKGRCMTKIHRVCGCLVGFTGSSHIGFSLIDWWTSGADAATYPGCDEKDGSAQLIVVKPSGVFVHEGRVTPIEYTGRHMAWGSGAELALGALEMGADARTAVEVASRYDIYTGGGVDVLRLG